MTRALPLLLLSTLALAGCDQLGMSSSGATTDTNMRSVDIEAGTASDEMIILDQSSGDGTAVDTSTATGPAAPRPADAETDEDAAATSNEDAAQSTTGDQIIRPPAGGSEADSPPEPAKQ